VTDAELVEVRERLEAFAAELFAPMRRKDQRRWGCVYLRGLMLDGRRKSIEPMAERLPDGDEQCLQQFVNQSPWDWEAVRGRLARMMSEEIAPGAWIVDDTGFPKAGRWSVGVARQYCGALGKVSNCQVGVSISAATDMASCPLDWRLFLPEEWDSDAERRAKAHVPDGIGHLPKWRLALGMIDELRGWGLKPPVVLADGAYGEITEFRAGLESRELRYVVQVKGRTSAYSADVRPERPDYAGMGRPPKPRYRAKPASLKQLAFAAGREAAVEIGWREGTRGELGSRFLALRVRPANVELRNQASREGTELPLRWLLCEWPEGFEEPVKYWLSNLPAETPLVELVRLAKLRWRIEHDYRELKDALGLDHFEGRSYRGWNHHTTLVSVAHAFLTSERLRLEGAETEDEPTGEDADDDEPKPRRPFARAA
jgi:SRSO17 transposase